jgi:hypothetical protein
MSIEQDAQDNMKYQRWLAESLVANLGYDKATKVCVEMCWYGTLDLLMKEKNGHFARPAHEIPALTEAA